MSTGQSEPSGWAIGFTAYAAVMLCLIGFFHAFAGLVGVLENELYIVTPDYVFSFDPTTWGWIHLVLGAAVFFAGLGLLSGKTWARVVGVTIAILSTMVNFTWLPWYPLWSLVMITANMFVIWALTVHGRDIATR